MTLAAFHELAHQLPAEVLKAVRDELAARCARLVRRFSPMADAIENQTGGHANGPHSMKASLVISGRQESLHHSRIPRITCPTHCLFPRRHNAFQRSSPTFGATIIVRRPNSIRPWIVTKSPSKARIGAYPVQRRTSFHFSPESSGSGTMNCHPLERHVLQQRTAHACIEAKQARDVLRNGRHPLPRPAASVSVPPNPGTRRIGGAAGLTLAIC